MCDNLVVRAFNPLLYPDILFRLSSTGRQHDRNLVTLHGMTNKVIKTQRQKILQESAVADEVINDTGEKKYSQFLILPLSSSQISTPTEHCKPLETHLFFITMISEKSDIFINAAFKVARPTCCPSINSTVKFLLKQKLSF